MSKFEFKLPDIGEGVAEGEIVSWLVAVGDTVAEDQEMVEVMTDKATVTIGAPKAGKILQLGGNVGDVVPVGSLLVLLEVGEGGAEASAPAQAPEAPAGEKTEADKKKDEAPVVFPVPDQLPHAGNDKPLAAPATRKLAREIGVDLSTVPGSGPAGRITREDVEKAGARGSFCRRSPRARSAPRYAAPEGCDRHAHSGAWTPQAHLREHGAFEAHRSSLHLRG
jgi:pyruvate dehydrogenase E2 component (dihydrolipoamide acetyltransferase)